MPVLEDILGTTFTCTLDEASSWRGEGFVRVDDGWVTIPGALPGETVTCTVEHEVGRGRRVFATLEHVLEASNDRVDAHCPRVNYCRGCQLRHASPAAESRFKHDRIRELMQKFAGVEVQAIGSVAPEVSRELGYRWRAHLTYRSEGSPQLGLVSGTRSDLIPMSDCPSLSQKCRRLVAQIASVFAALANPWPDDDAPGALRGVTIWASDPPFVGLEPRSRSTRTAADLAPLVRCLESGVDGAVVGLADEVDAWFKLPYRAGPFDLWARAGAWVHATVEPAEALYCFLSQWLSTDDSAHLDVGCGVGSISLLAAHLGRRSAGIDRNLAAVASARENARRNGLEATFIASDWEKGARKLLENGERFGTATLNPMREPVGVRTLTYLNKLVTGRILVLGPSPESAAKEIASLAEMGWRSTGVWNVDLHPASYQSMVAVELKNEGSGASPSDVTPPTG